MTCDPKYVNVEPLADGDYEVTVSHVVRKEDKTSFRFEMCVDNDGALRLAFD